MGYYAGAMRLTQEARRLLGRSISVQRDGGIGEAGRRLRRKIGIYGATPYQRRRYRQQTFSYHGSQLAYFIHSHSATWENERMIEIPIANHFLQRRGGGRGLEVGNVLAYYAPVARVVVDKYERAPGVLNADVVDYAPQERYDWIVSISTLEHVGQDEAPLQPGKAVKAVEHLRGLLAPGGRMLVTVPLGYNTGLDAYIRVADAVSEAFFVRSGDGWTQETRERALSGSYTYGPFANCLWVAEFAPREADRSGALIDEPR